MSKINIKRYGRRQLENVHMNIDKEENGVA